MPLPRLLLLPLLLAALCLAGAQALAGTASFQAQASADATVSQTGAQPDPKQSVYRVWIAIRVGSLSKPPRNYQADWIRGLRNKGVHFIPQKDRQGKVASLWVLFVHEGEIYVFSGGHGSCYRVSDQDHFVSNDHVVRKEKPEWRFFVPSFVGPDSIKVHPVTVLWQDAKKDLAILSIPGLPPSPPLPFADPAHIKAGAEAVTIGFTGRSDDIGGARGLLDLDNYLAPRVHNTSLVGSYQDFQGVKIWQLFAGASGGNSGGPVLTMCGQVAGTLYAGSNYYGTVRLSVAVEELLPELDRLGVPYVRSEGLCLPPAAKITRTTTVVQTPDLTWLYVVLGGLACVFVLCAGYVFRLRRQVAGGAMPRVNSRLLRNMLGMPPDTPVPQDNTPKAVNLAASADKVDNCASGVNKAAGPAGLRLAPLFAGAPSLPLAGAGKIVVGREAACSLVINDPIISKKHCEVSLAEDGSVELRDLGSANGVFADGVSGRVQAVRLGPGEGFYLADKKYAFRIEGEKIPEPDTPVRKQP